MKQFVIDELRLPDFKALKDYLNDRLEVDTIDGIYWLPINPEILTETQRDHKECQPFYVAVELMQDRISVEFLLRTKHRVRCNCMAYATNDQSLWLMHEIDSIFQQLDIKC
jgi:hypothetical protein